MRPFKRVKMLHADEYRVLKKAVSSRKMAAGKARRAKIVLLSNQGHTAREIAARLDCNERTRSSGSAASTATAWPASRRYSAGDAHGSTVRRTSGR